MLHKSHSDVTQLPWQHFECKENALKCKHYLMRPTYYVRTPTCTCTCAHTCTCTHTHYHTHTRVNSELSQSLSTILSALFHTPASSCCHHNSVHTQINQSFNSYHGNLNRRIRLHIKPYNITVKADNCIDQGLPLYQCKRISLPKPQTLIADNGAIKHFLLLGTLCG